jgi:hypothetical protein
MVAVQDAVCKSREDWTFDRWRGSARALERREIETGEVLEGHEKLGALQLELESIEKELPNGLKRSAFSLGHGSAWTAL